MKVSKVYRNLDSKLKILGFELFDLLAVAGFAAVMNLIFGRTSLSVPFVFGLPGIIGVALFISKRNKPDSFLIHFIRYHILPGAFAPGNSSNREIKMRKKFNENS